MVVRSDRLGQPTLIPVLGEPTVFEVPLGQTWLIKRVSVTNLGVTAGRLVLSWWTATARQPVLDVDVAGGRTVDVDTWLPFDAGSRLIGDALTNEFGVTAWGAKLEGVAP